MSHVRYLVVGCLAAVVLCGEFGRPAQAWGQQAAAQPMAAAAREVPPRSIPVPDSVSPQMQAIIAQPPNPNW